MLQYWCREYFRGLSCNQDLQESEHFQDLAQSSIQLLRFSLLLRCSIGGSEHADITVMLHSEGRFGAPALTPAAWDLLSVSKQVAIKIFVHYVRNYFWPGACSQTLCIRAKEGSGPQEMSGTRCLWWTRQRKYTGLDSLLPCSSEQDSWTELPGAVLDWWIYTKLDVRS